MGLFWRGLLSGLRPWSQTIPQTRTEVPLLTAGHTPPGRSKRAGREDQERRLNERLLIVCSFYKLSLESGANYGFLPIAQRDG